MDFLYSAVSRGATLLAQHASAPSNFDSALVDVLGRVVPGESRYMARIGDASFFILSDAPTGLCFVVACGGAADADAAYAFLEELKLAFVTGVRLMRDPPPFAYQQSFAPRIAQLLAKHSARAATASLDALDALAPSDGDIDSDIESDSGGAARGGRMRYALLALLAAALVIAAVAVACGTARKS